VWDPTDLDLAYKSSDGVKRGLTGKTAFWSGQATGFTLAGFWPDSSVQLC
jgi:hypothetical protein